MEAPIFLSFGNFNCVMLQFKVSVLQNCTKHIYIYIERERERGWVLVTPIIPFINIISLNNFLLDVSFEKSTVGLYCFLLPYMHAKYQDG